MPPRGLTVASPQLQEAFSRGALKPGLNVVLEERPKRRNDAVSGARGAGRRLPGAEKPPPGLGPRRSGQGRPPGLLHRCGDLGCHPAAVGQRQPTV